VETPPLRTVEHLLEELGLSIEELARRSGLARERVEAIADGRWLPGPADRERIAKAFGLEVKDISWGHTMNPRNVRYRRFGLKENF
jgi:transcriptional regulator with XRE-family HTH domain